MKIYLLSFVDTNFGDNLFIHTVVSRYKEHDFYMIVNEEYRNSYELLCQYEENIHLISREESTTFLKDMDGMLVVGGDMFGNDTYTVLRAQINTVKSGGGFVAFLGISLFDDYTFKTKLRLREMFSKADHIVVRESKTYKQIRKLLISTPVVISTDMAFNTDITAAKAMETEGGLLGISVRKKIPRNTPDAYKVYCRNIARMAVEYLKESESNKINFLAFSKGVYDDEVVTQDIMNLCPEEYRGRLNCTTFKGDVEKYILEIQKCEKLICTRFHALVFAILLNKPFIPVIYEDKMTRLLDEVGYEGTRLYYEEENTSQAVYNFYSFKAQNASQLQKYMTKADSFFVETDRMIL